MHLKQPFDDMEPFQNDSGFVVFTAEYLLQRGYCCGNGCRNCPYDYKNVINPQLKQHYLALRYGKREETDHEHRSLD